MQGRKSSAVKLAVYDSLIPRLRDRNTNPLDLIQLVGDSGVRELAKHSDDGAAVSSSNRQVSAVPP